jgi:hypothetical protein
MSDESEVNASPGGGTRNMPYPPVARRTIGLGHTAAPAARRPAGHQREMSVECHVSGLPDIPELRKWRRDVAEEWQGVRKSHRETDI